MSTAVKQPIKMHVEYRDIPGFPNYRVGSDGSIWSCRKKGSKHKLGEWHRLATETIKNGRWRKNPHLFVKLRPIPGGKPVHLLVHVAALIAFVGPRPEGMECRHLDGDGTNNRLENLCWGTRRENVADQIRHGVFASRGDKHAFRRHPELVRRGERSPTAKLTEHVVKEILLRAANGECQRRLSEEYGVCPATVCNIIKRKVWRHVS